MLQTMWHVLGVLVVLAIVFWIYWSSTTQVFPSNSKNTKTTNPKKVAIIGAGKNFVTKKTNPKKKRLVPIFGRLFFVTFWNIPPIFFSFSWENYSKGCSGLVSGKEILEKGHKIKIYESTNKVGGTFAHFYQTGLFFFFCKMITKKK